MIPVDGIVVEVAAHLLGRCDRGIDVQLGMVGEGRKLLRHHAHLYVVGHAQFGLHPLALSLESRHSPDGKVSECDEDDDGEGHNDHDDYGKAVALELVLHLQLVHMVERVQFVELLVHVTGEGGVFFGQELLIHGRALFAPAQHYQRIGALLTDVVLWG